MEVYNILPNYKKVILKPVKPLAGFFLYIGLNFIYIDKKSNYLIFNYLFHKLN